MMPAEPTPIRRKSWHQHLYAQVLVAIALGVALGAFAPAWGEAMKPLATGFIKLVKMIIAPVIFATVVTGIAKVGDLKAVGRVGLKALLYFEVVTTFALAIGLVVVNVVQPGVGSRAVATTRNVKDAAKYVEAGRSMTVEEHLLRVIPDSAVGAFVGGEILQVLLVSVLFGVALALVGAEGRPMVEGIERLAHVLFAVVGILMRAAPLGAFGAMAATVGAGGLEALEPLGKLMLCVYATSALFVFLVLGSIIRLAGVRLWPFLRYIRDEILLVLATSSSESALPRLMGKLENLGCGKSVVGLVVPTGYSFNLDGTSIYLTMAAIFVAQAANVHLGLGEQLEILAILLLTSKGAAAVTGGGFVTLAATLSATHRIPVAGLAPLVGIDRFMSEARAITNLIGNGVATLVIARWEGAFDVERARSVLAGEALPPRSDRVSFSAEEAGR